MTKLFWIAAPAIAFGAYVLARALLRRPVSRPVMSGLTALLLLFYVLATAALGLFWVARMDLPAFDLHYLFGYCTLLLLVAHLVFQVRPLAATLRRVGPRWLSDADGKRFLPAVRLGLRGLLAMLVFMPAAAYLVGRLATERSAIHVEESPAASGSAPAGLREVWIMREGSKTRAVDWLYETSALSRTSAIEAPVVVVEEPDDVKVVEGRATRLPPAAAKAGRSLAAALGGDEAVAPEGAIVVDHGSTSAPDSKAIATLLHYAAGVTSRKAESGGLLLRAAASAGALYPTDLYVVAESVGEGAFYYHPHLHSLANVAARARPIRDALPDESPARQAPLLFVFGATFDRTGFKYGTRAYRYSLLDAGHVAANLVLAAKAMGLACGLETHFDDHALIAAVGGSEQSEGALLVVGCGGKLPKTTPRIPSHRPVELPKTTHGRETARLSHRLTAWQLQPGEVTAWRRLSHKPVPKKGVALPAGKPATEDLFGVIAARRSVRQFKEQDVELAALGEVLRDAWQGARSLQNADLVELHVLARRVRGLDAGGYRYEAGSHKLLKTTSQASELKSAGLDQEVLGLAAFTLVWGYTSDLGKLEGARDFRVGALQAGLGGEAAYLSATARGLGVCGVGAFYDEEVAARVAGPKSRPLYLMALGPR